MMEDDEDEQLVDEEDDIDAEIADVVEAGGPNAEKAQELLDLRTRAQVIVDKRHAEPFN